jgi:hypothetical protein
MAGDRVARQVIGGAPPRQVHAVVAGQGEHVGLPARRPSSHARKGPLPPSTVSPVTRAAGSPAATTRASMRRANSGSLARATAAGTSAS